MEKMLTIIKCCLTVLLTASLVYAQSTTFKDEVIETIETADLNRVQSRILEFDVIAHATPDNPILRVKVTQNIIAPLANVDIIKRKTYFTSAGNERWWSIPLDIFNVVNPMAWIMFPFMDMGTPIHQLIIKSYEQKVEYTMDYESKLKPVNGSATRRFNLPYAEARLLVKPENISLPFSIPFYTNSYGEVDIPVDTFINQIKALGEWQKSSKDGFTLSVFTEKNDAEGKLNILVTPDGKTRKGAEL
ncbi:MAG: hypothetical protein HY757_10720 [Nitrospirae bacterium]|nr:hypothetical protein [Nitrospirota bacterium]